MTRAAPASLIAATAGLALLAAACTPSGTAPRSSSAAPAAPQALSLPEGGGCTGEIARTRAVIANDLSTGHVTRAVHDRFSAELDRAAATCSAGKDAEAVRLVRATKARFGYP